jgi:hypothetical protein
LAPFEITDAAIVLVTLSTNRLKIVLKSEFKWDNNSFKKEDAVCVLKLEVYKCILSKWFAKLD